MFLFLKFIFIILFFSMPVARAFQIDTLTRIITHDNDYLELTGENSREYIYTQLTQVVSDGKEGSREIPFNPEEVSGWPVIVEPGEIVIDKGDSVRVKINRNGPQRDEDIVLGLAFIPESISGKGVNSSALQISVGYKSWLFMPGKAPLRGKLNAYRENGKLVIHNMTNKILRVAPVGCEDRHKEACSGSVISLPETRKQIDIAESVRVLHVYLIGDSHKKVKEIVL